MRYQQYVVEITGSDDQWIAMIRGPRGGLREAVTGNTSHAVLNAIWEHINMREFDSKDS